MLHWITFEFEWWREQPAVYCTNKNAVWKIKHTHKLSLKLIEKSSRVRIHSRMRTGLEEKHSYFESWPFRHDLDSNREKKEENTQNVNKSSKQEKKLVKDELIKKLGDETLACRVFKVRVSYISIFLFPCRRFFMMLPSCANSFISYPHVILMMLNL